MTATAVPVTTGMETDFYLEISSDGLADGDQVLSDASTVIPGHARHAGGRHGRRGSRGRRDGGLSMSDEKLAWSPMPDGSLIIDMQGIYKRFYIGQPNELEILKGIDLQVGRGEFVSIVGASGSGKSTR